ncbi:MAG: hypothetical protein R3F07_04530 [Opitutaceae bacterium]
MKKVPTVVSLYGVWLVASVGMVGWVSAVAEAQDRYIEVIKGNIFVHPGATDQTRQWVQRSSQAGFNSISIGSLENPPSGTEATQGSESGLFTLAETTAIDMLVSADRNPERFAGLNPLAVKAILLTGARLSQDGPGVSDRMDKLDGDRGSGLISRHRSLELFSAGRKTPGSNAERPMGWDRAIVYSGHPNRYGFEVGEGAAGDFSAALALNPELTPSGSFSVAGIPQARLRLRRQTEDGAPGEIILSSKGGNLTEYLHLGSLSTGHYVLEVESSADGLVYGLAWHSQVHGMVPPKGNHDPVFIFRRGSSDDEIELGTRVEFSGVAYGALTDAVKIEFFAGSTKIGETNRPEFDFSWIANQYGVSSIYAVVTDRYGNQVFSSGANVGVRIPESPPAAVSGPILPANLSGIYWGTVSSGGVKGWIALSVLPSGSATCLGYFGGQKLAFVGRDGVVESDGQLSFPSIDEIGGSSVGVGSLIPDGSLRGAISKGVATVSSADGKLAISVTRSTSSGTLLELQGLVELGVLNRDGGRVFLVSDRSGKTKGIVSADGSLVEVNTIIRNTGTLSLDLGDGKSLMLELGAASGQVSGILSSAGQPDEELLGIRDSIESRKKIANISTRGLIGKGNGMLIAGFVVDGDSPKQVLIRAVGPSMASLGVEGMAGDPKLIVRKTLEGVNSIVAINEDWDASSNLFGDIGEKVGAFPLLPGKTDAAIILTLEPGVYTAEMSDPGRGGLSLIEVYDVESEESPSSDRIVNISTRGKVHGGKVALVGGFVVEGNAPKLMLVRGVGPSLANLGISGYLSDANLTIDLQENGQSIPIQENDDWGKATNPALIRSASEKVGAFPLNADGKDAAILVLLKPGAYTARLGAVGTKSGTALLEVYEVGGN